MPAIKAKTAHTAAARYLQHHSHISPIRSKIPIAIRQTVTEIGNIIISPLFDEFIITDLSAIVKHFF